MCKHTFFDNMFKHTAALRSVAKETVGCFATPSIHWNSARLIGVAHFSRTARATEASLPKSVGKSKSSNQLYIRIQTRHGSLVSRGFSALVIKFMGNNCFYFLMRPATFSCCRNQTHSTLYSIYPFSCSSQYCPQTRSTILHHWLMFNV